MTLEGCYNTLETLNDPLKHFPKTFSIQTIDHPLAPHQSFMRVASEPSGPDPALFQVLPITACVCAQSPVGSRVFNYSTKADTPLPGLRGEDELLFL